MSLGLTADSEKLLLLLETYRNKVICCEKSSYTLHQKAPSQMQFLITEIISPSSSAHSFCVFGSTLVYQVNVTHSRLSFVTVVIELLHGLGLGR